MNSEDTTVREPGLKLTATLTSHFSTACYGSATAQLHQVGSKRSINRATH